ncbi:MAG: hypothetical protein HY313_07890 [Acidobacteria bacterium]|nr:hypothetical protein [Acidobacteriota bacterium]
MIASKNWISSSVFFYAVGAFLPVWLFSQAQQGRSPSDAWMTAPPTSTGIAVGKRIPDFNAVDQFGKMRNFSSIRGPKGAAIFFNRSADW